MSRADNSGSTGDGNALGESNEQRIARLLAQNLGREHLETRKGPAGIMLTYLSIGTAINLANEIFGFNGQSLSLRALPCSRSSYRLELAGDQE